VPKQHLAFTDRLLVTLVHLRLRLPHVGLVELHDMDRSTGSGAIRDVRPLPATRGFVVPQQGRAAAAHSGDLFSYADVEGCRAADRRHRSAGPPPACGLPGRKAFMSGKKKQHTLKTTTFSYVQGRILSGGVGPVRSRSGWGYLLSVERGAEADGRGRGGSARTGYEAVGPLQEGERRDAEGVGDGDEVVDVAAPLGAFDAGEHRVGHRMPRAATRSASWPRHRPRQGLAEANWRGLVRLPQGPGALPAVPPSSVG
jgi:hypothetical protein